MIRTSILVVAAGLLVEVLSAQLVTRYLELNLLTAPTRNEVEAGDKFNLVLSFDSSLLTGTGVESFDVSDGGAAISLNFSFINDIYDETDDIAGDSPRLYFFDGLLTGLRYRTTLNETIYGPDSFAIFYKDRSFEYSLDGSGEFEGFYTIHDTQPIPEPRTMALACCGVGLFFYRKRRDGLMVASGRREVSEF